jgi:hypothetical protein
MASKNVDEFYEQTERLIKCTGTVIPPNSVQHRYAEITELFRGSLNNLKHLVECACNKILEVKIMQPLYKFFERKWADEFVSGRSIRVGTISDFRNIEEHQLQKGDVNEGYLHFGAGKETFCVGEANFLNVGRYGPIEVQSEDVFSRLFKRRTGSSPLNNVTFRGFTKAAVVLEVGDAYVLCLSSASSREAARTLDLKYDTCVKIGNPEMLVKSVTNSLVLGEIAYSYQKFGAVKYSGIAVGKHDDVEFEEAFFLKGTEFAEQQEHRMIWTTNGQIAPYTCAFDPNGCGLEILW